MKNSAHQTFAQELRAPVEDYVARCRLSGKVELLTTKELAQEPVSAFEKLFRLTDEE